MKIIFKCECGNELEIDSNELNGQPFDYCDGEDSFEVAGVEVSCDGDDAENIEDIEVELTTLSIQCTNCGEEIEIEFSGIYADQF